MKRIKIIFAVFLFAEIIFSQSNDSLQADSSEITSKPAMQELPEMPARWKKESAIILELNKTYSAAYNYAYGYYVNDKQRRKILLQDKAAVEAYSEIHFPVSEYENISVSGNDWNTSYSSLPKTNFKCSVLKKDGSVIELNSSDAIPMQVSNSKNFYWGAYTYMKKLAVPNLEPGDIIDYEYSTIFSVNGGRSQRIDLAESYPVLHMTIDFELPYYFYFEQVPIATDKILEGRARSKTDTRNLRLLLDSVEKWKDEMWTYESRSLPAIRFRIQTDYNMELENRKYDKKYLQTTIANELFRNKSMKKNGRYSKKILFWLAKNKKATDNSDSIVSKAYYYFRYLITRDALNGKLYDPLSPKSDEISDALFCKVMLDVLNKSKIPAKQVCYVPRNQGKLADALTPFEYSLCVKAGEGDLFLFNFTSNSVSSEIPENCDDVDAFAFSASRHYKKTKFYWMLSFNPTFIALPLAVYIVESSIHRSHQKPDITEVKIPASSAAKHVIASNYIIDMNKIPESDKIEVIRKSSRTGNFKSEYNSLLINPFQSKTEDEKELNIASSSKNKLYGTLAAHEEELKSKLQGILDMRLKDYMKEQLESDAMMIENYKGYKVLNSGRFSNSPALEMEENFTLTNVYSHPEDNLIILNAGSIIGEQISLKESDIKRENDIYFANARTIKNSITLKVPEGYKAENIKDFIFNLENETGSFSSNAMQVGNTIKIETKKIYKTDMVKKEDWSKMVLWLDAAYHFTQKKLFLRK